MISTVDPEARHAHKTVHRRQDGFKAHIAVEPDTGLITDCALTKASGPGTGDAAVGAALLADEAPSTGGRCWPIRRTAPVTARAELAAGRAHRGDQADAAAPGGAGRVHPRRLHRRPRRRHGDLPERAHPADHAETGTVTFGAACRGCPLRDRCTTAHGRPAPRRPRARHLLRRALAGRPKPPSSSTVYRQHRPMVERSIAWLTRGNRKRPLPRRRQERPLAAPPRRRAQPAPTAHPRPDPHPGGWALT